MRRLIRHRARRVPAILFCLALFLAGSNYCLLSAWGGNTRMACMVSPGGATAAAATPRCHHCAPTGRASRAGHETAGRSCCPDPVLMPAVPSLDKVVPSHASPSRSVLAAVAAPSVEPIRSRHSPPRLLAGQPPTGPASAPLAPRAPPLA